MNECKNTFSGALSVAGLNIGNCAVEISGICITRLDMFVRFICRLEKKLRETTDFRPQTVSKTQQKHYKSEKKKKEKKVGPAEI